MPKTRLLCVPLVATLMIDAFSSGPAAASTPPPPWLTRINMYRAMAQVPALANDPVLTDGAQNHAIAEVRNLVKHLRDRPSIKEPGKEPGSQSLPHYNGQAAARAPQCETDISLGAGQSQEQAIDRWIKGPLRRMLLLNPQLRRIGYGYYCEGEFCAQSIDVEDGIAREPVDPDQEVAIEFPPANLTLSLNDLTKEEPDPLTACPGYSYPVGLPITFEIGAFVGAQLSSYSIVKKDDPGGRPLEACGYDAFSYRNASRSQLAHVVGRLRAFSGVVVIPRHPLAAGNYRASVTVNGRDYSWAFAIAPNDSRSAAR